MKLCVPYEGEHCCLLMKKYLDDWRIPIDFDTETNLYFLPFVWPYTTKQGLVYCPWCGKKLPRPTWKELKDQK